MGTRRLLAGSAPAFMCVLLAAVFALVPSLAFAASADDPPAITITAADKAARFGALVGSPRIVRVSVGLAPGRPGLPAGLDLPGLGLRQTGTIARLGVVLLEVELDPREIPSSGLQEQAAVAVQDRVGKALGTLRKAGGVAWAEVEVPQRIAATPNDPWYSQQWSMPAVRLPEAWDLTTGSAAVVIAVLDSGLEPAIADFAGKIVSPYSVPNQSIDPGAWLDVLGHGTAVAAVAAAVGDDAAGVAGAAWNARIMPVHLSDTGEWTDNEFAQGVVWAVDHGADIINYSAGGSQTTSLERSAIDYALSRGVPVIAAAGNDGPGSGLYYPAAYSDVVSVGSTDQSDVVSPFSQTGSTLDLVAPGERIVTWFRGSAGKWGAYYLDGTSFSAPLVSGVAALLLSRDASLTPARLETVLEGSAKDIGPPGWDSSSGAGRLDSAKAVSSVGSTTTTTAPPTTTTRASTTTTTTPPTTTTSDPPTTTTTRPSVGFTDVSLSDPYRSAILGMADLGVISGYGDGTFRPRSPVLRAQFAKMICGVMGIPLAESTPYAFRDLGSDSPTSLYPHEYVGAAAAKGVILGYADGTFHPFVGVSRAQVLTMVVRAARNLRPGLLTQPPSGYTSAMGSFDTTHAPNLAWAEYNGLLAGLQGYGQTWNPWTTMSRGEVAQVLWNLVQKR